MHSDSSRNKCRAESIPNEEKDDIKIKKLSVFEGKKNAWTPRPRLFWQSEIGAHAYQVDPINDSHFSHNRKLASSLAVFLKRSGTIQSIRPVAFFPFPLCDM